MFKCLKNMKQILFAVLLCVCSLCPAQKTTSKSPDKPQYFLAYSLKCDSFYLEFRKWNDKVVDCDEPLCNILRFKRIKDNEMLLIGDKQNYRLTADYPFKLEWRKINKGRFELLGLRTSVPDYSPGMTISAKVEDSNKKTNFYREYRLLPSIDLYVEYVGTDQKPHIANLSCGWPKPDFDPQKEMRLFLKERGGEILPPIKSLSMRTPSSMEYSLPPAVKGDTLTENLRRYLAYRRKRNDGVSIYVEYETGQKNRIKTSYYIKDE